MIWAVVELPFSVVANGSLDATSEKKEQQLGPVGSIEFVSYLIVLLAFASVLGLPYLGIIA